MEELAPLVTEPDFGSAVRELYDALVELDRKPDTWSEQEWDRMVSDSGESPQLLAAGGPTGEFPSFAALAPSRGHWYAGPGHAVHAVGIWAPWLKERGKLRTPDTLADSRRMILSLATAFLAYLYEGKTFEQWCDELGVQRLKTVPKRWQ